MELVISEEKKKSFCDRSDINRRLVIKGTWQEKTNKVKICYWCIFSKVKDQSFLSYFCQIKHCSQKCKRVLCLFWLVL